VNHLLISLIFSILCSPALSLDIYTNTNNNHILGRDNDPKVVSDIGKIKLLYKKSFWSILSILGPRNIAKIVYPKSISHMNVENAVAFTIDDGFCGLDNPDGDMLNEVRLLLKKYNAHATFFVAGTHCAHTNIEDINKLLDDGHELANHNLYDIPYDKHTSGDFEIDLLMTQNILNEYTDRLSKWYRAPHATISKNMHKVIEKHQLTHVIGDAFANDTSIPDPKWIAKYILKKTKPGSIIIIHMPERGIREWNYEAMEIILEGLNQKNYQIHTLTNLDSLE